MGRKPCGKINGQPAQCLSFKDQSCTPEFEQLPLVKRLNKPQGWFTIDGTYERGENKQLNTNFNMCRELRKVWYQCRHELVYKYYCKEARRTGLQCPSNEWQHEKLEHFGGTNIPCEHPDCVRWARHLAEMRQETLERNIADAMYRRID
ncbi:hypothetical protein KCU71_g655, partial [Aureobasidium melanogenum]